VAGKGLRDSAPRTYAWLAWAYVALLMLPLYYLLVSSFKDNTSIFNSPFALPSSISFESYRAAFEQAQLGRGLLNSIVVTVLAEVLTLTLALPAAYALARATGRLGALVERLFSLGFLIPSFAALVPSVLLAIALQMFQTRSFLVMLFAAQAMPLSVILLTNFMRAVPNELWESASIDGAGRGTILLRIYLPLVVPGISTVAILNYLAFWNEYLFTVSIVGLDSSIRTSQVALPTLVNPLSTQWDLLMAGSLITMVPVFLVYIVLQQRMSKALIEGSVKA
jgi:multiple sugar transport system permease protein